ncbi:HAD family hydrolase [Saccharicrinis carchari]|nr:HAD family hydrolase [Saccharicrinis carchari]
MNKKYKWIGFDADDTIWENETFFRETEYQFAKLLSEFCDEQTIMQELYKTELDNLKDYGFGIKGFMLSMIETAIRLSKGKVGIDKISCMIELGKCMLNKPVKFIDGSKEVIESLSKKGYKLVVLTKGDLLDQERKLSKANIKQYFHHIEIMSDKQEANYNKILEHLNIEARDFLMIGNSLKSDILPVLNLGGSAVHIPFHTTWVHEEVENNKKLENFWELEQMAQLEEVLGL